MPLIATAAIGGISSLVAGHMGSSAAKNAAAVQSDAAVKAAQINSDASTKASQLSADATNRATDLQKNQFDTQQANLQPWLDAGKQGLAKLSDFVNQDNNFTDTFTGPTYKAPAAFDPNTVQFDPGFAKRMEAGNRILTSGFAAKGNLGNGRAAEALVKANQDMTSDEYGTAYNRDYGAYKDSADRSYNQFSDDYTRALNEYRQKVDIFNTNKTNQFNRLAGVTGVGQQATNQLGDAGSQFANNTSNILTAGANTQGNIITNTATKNANLTQDAAAATAAGQVGSANAWTGALKNIVNGVNGSLTLSMIPGLGKRVASSGNSTQNFNYTPNMAFG